MSKKLKTICIIPARGGSKGLPGKNLRLFNGKPLIAWPIIAAKRCKNIDTVIVTTDSEEIATQAKLFGASVPSLRPSNLAQDNSTTETTLKYALDNFEENIKFRPHPTSMSIEEVNSHIYDLVESTFRVLGGEKQNKDALNSFHQIRKASLSLLETLTIKLKEMEDSD